MSRAATETIHTRNSDKETYAKNIDEYLRPGAGFKSIRQCHRPRTDI